jgi:signal transduction histidine kinase
VERSAFRLATYFMQGLRAGQDNLKDQSCHLQLQVFNVSLYIALLLALLAVLGVSLTGQWDVLLMLPLPALALYSMTLYLARRHCFLTARLVFLLVSHLTLGYGVVLYGKETNLSLYCLHLTLFPFLLFRAQEWRWIIVSSISAFVMFQVVELNLLPSGTLHLKPRTLSILRCVFTLGSFIGIILPAVLLLCQSKLHYRRALQRHRLGSLNEKLSVIACLSAGAAHEIQNPLTTLHLTLDHLEGLAAPQGQPTICMRIQKAYAAIHRIHSILQKLLVSTQRVPSLPEPLYVTTIAQLIMQRCKSYLNHHGIDLHVKMDLTHEAVIRCHRQHVMEAVDSLIHNALEAMMGHKAATLSLTLSSQDDFFQVEVADTGPGVSEDMIRSLFTPFYTTKAVGAGLGLSLYNARCMARQYGGDLTCKCGPGGRFCLSLPLQKLS